MEVYSLNFTLQLRFPEVDNDVNILTLISNVNFWGYVGFWASLNPNNSFLFYALLAGKFTCLSNSNFPLVLNIWMLHWTSVEWGRECNSVSSWTHSVQTGRIIKSLAVSHLFLIRSMYSAIYHKSQYSRIPVNYISVQCHPLVTIPTKHMHRFCAFSKYDKIWYCLYSHLDNIGSCHTDLSRRVFFMIMDEIKEQDNHSMFLQLASLWVTGCYVKWWNHRLWLW